MEILTRKICNSCAGIGWQDTKLGSDFKSFCHEFEKEHSRHVDREDIEKWCKERGVKNLYPMSEQCYSCNGAGYTNTWVEIDALREIIEQKGGEA